MFIRLAKILSKLVKVGKVFFRKVHPIGLGCNFVKMRLRKGFCFVKDAGMNKK